MKIKRYSELARLETFEEKLEYLKLDGSVGQETFGYDRYLNQMFYKTKEWRSVRDYVIARDNGNDMGCDGFPIFGPVYIHHMNPMRKSDILEHSDSILDPEFLVAVSFETHNTIHYGDIRKMGPIVVERSPNDTCPWKK